MPRFREFLILFHGVISLVISQNTLEIPPPEYIKTIQFEQNGNHISGVPIIRLGSGFEINFDDIIGDEAFYYYKIKYYNFDWSETTISKNEYLDGLDNIRIENTENSLNSLQIYTHYRVRIPNRDLQGLKLSGNYMFELYNENEELVFTKKFILYENVATTRAETKRVRDIEFINSKQNVQFSIDTGNIIINNPEENLKTLILQNRNLSTAITNLTPQYTIGTTFVYKYNLESSFWGGNEYWNFDNKEIRNASVNISHIELKDIYHHYLYTHFPRKNRAYTFNPDINGNFVVRNIAAQNNDIEAEYVWVHFSLKMEPLKNEEVHLYGGFNNFIIDKSTRLDYDNFTRSYQGKLLLKQGFHNFKYVVVHANKKVDLGAISGNFDETENEYTILFYYRGPGERYDRVISKGETNSTNITN